MSSSETLIDLGDWYSSASGGTKPCACTSRRGKSRRTTPSPGEPTLDQIPRRHREVQGHQGRPRRRLCPRSDGPVRDRRHDGQAQGSRRDGRALRQHGQRGRDRAAEPACRWHRRQHRFPEAHRPALRAPGGWIRSCWSASRTSPSGRLGSSRQHQAAELSTASMYDCDGRRSGHAARTRPTCSSRTTDRHVWLYRDNPNGVFTSFNPAVSCEHHKPGANAAHAAAPALSQH